MEPIEKSQPPRSPPPPLARSASQMSIGFPEESNPQHKNKPLIRPTAPPSDKNLPVYDQCCIGLFCVDHDKLLTARLKNKGLYIPNFPIRKTESWYEVAERSIESILKSKQLDSSNIVMTEQLVDITRIQLPKLFPHFLVKVTFVLAIKHEEGACQSKPDDLYTWMTFDEIYHNPTLWGFEPVELFKTYRNFNFELKLRKCSPWPMTAREYDEIEATKYLLQPGFGEKELLLSARFRLEEVQKLYNEFVMQCFPSIVMTYHSFKIFLSKLGWINDEEILLKMVFRSFTVSVANNDPKANSFSRSVPFLTFDELVIGLAAIDERADHRANCLRLRLSYIFNFYDIDQDGKLSTTELNQMVLDIKKRHGATEPTSSFTESEIEGTVGEILRRAGTPLLEYQTPQFITFEQFRKLAESELHSAWVAELTEFLFRTNISTIDVASSKFDYRVELDPTKVLKSHAVMDSYEGACEKCYEVQYNICSHGIKIDEHGVIRSTIKFDLSPFYNDTSFLQELNVNEEQFSMINTELRRLSFIAIARTSEDSNIEKLRQTNIDIIENVGKILKMAKEIIKKEPLIVECSAPCFIIGELWSNIFNLHALISSIARTSPFVNPANVVFLGNYVDPNSSLGVESLLQLMCYKILIPHRIHLLRGYNEFISPDEKNFFHKECQTMYGSEILRDIYEIFALLPLMAVLDNRIFLSKSGFPNSNKPLSKIESFNIKPKKPIFKLDDEIKHIMLSKPLRKFDTVAKSRTRRSLEAEKKKTITTISLKKSINKVQRNSKKSRKKSKIVTKKSSKTNKFKMKISQTKQLKLPRQKTEPNKKIETNLNFTPVNLKNFLRLNNFSHFIRSEHLQEFRAPSPVFSRQQTMLTLMGIGQPSAKEKPIKTNGTVAMADRYKIRIIRLEHKSNKTF